ncbi:hypothetical protein BS78_10G109700 [Paspalum vaginatum]|nr:hypothetical protein BS78_10G109700 [Paspalum vaginatum]
MSGFWWTCGRPQITRWSTCLMSSCSQVNTMRHRRL